MGVEITHQSLVKYRFGGLAPVYIYTYHHHKHTHFTMPETIRRKQTPSRLTISKPMTNPIFSKKGEPAKLQVTWRSPNSSPGDHSNVQMKKKKKKKLSVTLERRGDMRRRKGRPPPALLQGPSSCRTRPPSLVIAGSWCQVEFWTLPLGASSHRKGLCLWLDYDWGGVFHCFPWLLEDI